MQWRAGIEHCGKIARRLEAQRGKPFAFAVRTRYGLRIATKVLGAMPSWPIWSEAGENTGGASVLAFGKTRCPLMRCLPQDVFFVSRYFRP